MAAASAGLMALNLINSGLQYVGNRRAVSGVERQANYEGSVLDLNAGVADRQRADALARGRESEIAARTETRGLIGAQRAALGASGVDITTGSAADVQADAAGMGELEALTRRNNARREAYGYEVEAVNLRSRANMARAAGHNQAAGIRDAAASTLLTGALNTYGQWRSSRPAGASPGAVRAATKLGRQFAGSDY